MGGRGKGGGRRGGRGEEGRREGEKGGGEGREGKNDVNDQSITLYTTMPISFPRAKSGSYGRHRDVELLHSLLSTRTFGMRSTSIAERCTNFLRTLRKTGISGRRNSSRQGYHSAPNSSIGQIGFRAT